MTPINTHKGKPATIFGTVGPFHQSVRSAGPAPSSSQRHPEHPGRGAAQVDVGALTAAEPVVRGELQGALGAVPALPAELELALLHPAVCPGRHAAGERQVSLPWETWVKILFEPLSLKTDTSRL